MINQPPRVGSSPGPSPTSVPSVATPKATPSTGTGVATPLAGMTPGAKLPPLTKLPGAYNINLADPVGSANENARQSGDFVNGIGQTLFGKDTGSLLGGVPILGDVVRAASNVPGVGLAGGALGVALGGGIPAVVGIAERLRLGWLPGGSDATFDALPHTPEWQAVNDAASTLDFDPLGAGISNRKFDYTKKWLEDQEGNIRSSDGLRTLSSGLLAGPGGSVGGFAGQALALFQLPQRYVERGIAGTGAGGPTGINRLQETLARAQNGEKLTPVEQAVVQHHGDGSWTDERALDFLASHGAGLSSNQVIELVGSFATDPTVLASLGAGGLARLGARGAALAERGLSAGESVAVTAGRFARGEKVSTFLDRTGLAVNAAQKSAWGSGFKVARSIIDPLSAIGGKSPAGAAMLDLYTDNVAIDAFHIAHVSNPARAYQVAADAGLNIEKMRTAASGRGTSYAREMLGRMEQNEIVGGLHAESLFSPGDVAATRMSRAPKDIIKQVREFAFEHRKFQWTEAERAELGGQLARRFDGDPDRVIAAMQKAGKDQLGLYHDILYGGDEGTFAKIRDAVAHEYTGRVPYNRLNMMDQSALTDLGAAGFLKRIEAMSATSDEAKLELALLQDQFPAAKKYGKNVQYAIDDLTKRIAEGTEGKLPHQITGKEMAKMPQDLQDFFTDNPHRTLGFRPPDSELWNLSWNDVTGMLEKDGAPWTEHVFDGVAYRPGFELPFNIAGQVIPGPVGRAMDWLDAGARMLKVRTSGAMLRASAEQHFIETALKYNGDVITEDMARRAFRRVAAHFDAIDKPTILSMKSEQMYDAVRGVLPFNSGVTERDVLRWLVDGFEGDISKVGLAQKVPNKIRTLMTRALGYHTNAMYEFSQGLYNQLRFRGPLAIMFKKQEQIEPYALNFAEGSRMGRQATEANRETAATFQNLRTFSLMSGADQTDLLEQAPFAMKGPLGSGATTDLRGALEAGLNPDLAELKRLGQYNMFEARIGAAVRTAFEQDGRLDDFISFRNAYSEALGRQVSDAEYAQHWLNELQSATLSLGEDGRRLDLNGVFHEFETWGPADVGAVKRLGMDLAAARLNTLKDHEIKNINDLVEAMTPGSHKADADLIRDADVRDALARVGAPQAYVDRFMTALNFNWGRFWENAAASTGATPVEIKALQRWTSEAARLQGFKPTEFLSQVVSSGIKQKWTEEEITKNMALGLSVLRTPKGVSVDDLVGQLSAAFFGHLHPSGREALLRAMEKDGGLAGALTPPPAAAVSVPPSGTFEDVTDPLRGVEDVRNVAKVYMESHGLPVPPRRFLQVDPEFGLRTARAYDTLPGAAKVKPGPPVTQAMLETADTKLRSTRVDAATRRAYQAFVNETAEQYKAIRAAGIEIVPVRENPYASSAEMVADVRNNKTLKVFADVAGHPLLTDAQNVMFRGVHDYFAHAAEGFQFGPRGEVNAAIKHSQMYSEEARRAMLTETHGQNSYVNFSDKAVEGPSAPHPYDVSTRGAYNAPGYHYEITSKSGVNRVSVASSKETYRTEAEAVAAGDAYAQRLIEKVRQDLGGGSPSQTVADVNKAKPGSIYADQKAALLPQDIINEFNARYVGKAAPPAPPSSSIDADFSRRLTERVNSGVPSNDPNLENAFRYFGEWARASLHDSALGHADSELATLLKGIPGGGKPFDHTQAALVDAILARMKELENDTYRLQFFARDRSLLERSLNHPMFGLYPASYMWFKIMPQMVKFIAQRPFGLRTGALAYALADIQKDMVIQREFDPDFAKMIDGATSNQFLWLLSYLLPASPWDIPTAWPAWARDLAGQGLANERRAQQGQQPKGLNVSSVVTHVGDTIAPLRSISQTMRALGDLGDVISGTPEEQAKNPGQTGLASQVATPAQQLAAPLGDAADELMRILSGK